MTNYLKAAEWNDLRGLRSDVQDALRRLNQHAERFADQIRPAPELPWMRSVVVNGKGCASFDLTYYDLMTGQRVHPTAEALRHTIQYLTIFADAYELHEAKQTDVGVRQLSDHSQHSEKP